MKVGLNMLFLGPGSGGVGRYAVELAAALAGREEISLELFVSRDAPAELLEPARARGARITRLPVGRSGRFGYLAATFAGAPFLAARQRLDIFHSPANVGPFLVPGARTLITVHDLIWLRAGSEWDSQAAIDAMRRSTTLTVPRVDRIITDSHSSRRDLEAYLGPKLPPVDVVPLGVRPEAGPVAADEQALRERMGIGAGKVILCVAQKRPYKRQEVLVRALAGLPEEVVLVMPGASTPYERELKRLAGELGLSEQVVFPQWVSEEELDGLYRLAGCFALVSELEGFGLPVLEAMARGVPVVCSNRASLPEVAGDAATVVDPDDPAAVLEALKGALFDEELRAERSEAGRARAASFSWERTAEQTVCSYRAALQDRG